MAAWDPKEGAAFSLAISCDNVTADTILHRAVREGDLTLVDRLLRAGFPVDFFNDEGHTALHVAASLESVELCRVLLDHGANILAIPRLSKSDSRSVSCRGPRSSDHSDSDSSSDSDSDHIPGSNSGARSWSSTPSITASPKTPLDVAVDADDEDLLDLLLSYYPSPSDPNDEPGSERKLLFAMARALVAGRTEAIDTFHMHGWTFCERDDLTGRGLLHHVVQMAEDDGPVCTLLEAGVDAAAGCVGGITPLHVAAQLGPCRSGAVLQRLIEAGAPIYTVDDVFGGTPLSAAVLGGSVENVRVLLEAGADVSRGIRRRDMRRTALHVAAQDGVPDILKLLLAHGADSNALDEVGGTAAHWATDNGHLAAVRILLDHGMNPNADRGLALRKAISSGHLEIAKILVERGAKMNTRYILDARMKSGIGRDGMDMLLFCAETLAAASNPDQRADDADNASDAKVRWNMFSVPSWMRNEEYYLAVALLEHGIGTDTADLCDRARALLFCICAEYNLKRAISNLFAIGPVTKSMQRFGVRPYRWTALQVAIYKGHLDVARLLLKHGWESMHEDCDGRSALGLAACEGHYELVPALVATHGTAEHRDRHGNSPLLYAVMGPAGNDVGLLEALVSAGCDVSKANVEGETPLHLACTSNHGAAVEWLLVAGSPASAVNRAGNAPLHLAAMADAAAAIDILLEHHADVHAVAFDGATPLHRAAENGARAAVAALLAGGADPDRRDAKGRTALAVAVSSGRCDVPTLEELLSRTTVDWEAPRPANLLFAACLAPGTKGNRTATLECILMALRAAMGPKSGATVRRLMPELIADVLVSADDDTSPPVDVLRLLLDFMPKNEKTRGIIACHMLVAVIRHGGDEDAGLARALLRLDEDNAGQALPGMWYLLHLACKYGRLKTVRLLMGLAAPFPKTVVIDGKPHGPLEIAKRYSPAIYDRLDDLIRGAVALLKAVHRDPGLMPLICSFISKRREENS